MESLRIVGADPEIDLALGGALWPGPFHLRGDSALVQVAGNIRAISTDHEVTVGVPPVREETSSDVNDLAAVDCRVDSSTVADKRAVQELESRKHGS